MRHRVALAGLVAVAALVGAGPEAGAQAVLEQGHVDLVSVRVGAAGLEVGLSDDSSSPGAPVWGQPEHVVLRVPATAQETVPAGGAFGFLGPPGTPVWVLPQVQRPGLLWVGWNTESVPAGVLAGDSVVWRLAGADGPGTFSLFTTDQFGVPRVVFGGADGPAGELAVAAGSHARRTRPP